MKNMVKTVIDLNALRHNLSRVKQLAPDRKIISVIKANLEKSREEQEANHVTIRGLKFQMEELENRGARLKLLLLSRLHDYSKELTFWRDTVRKIIFQSTKQKTDVELIIETVTENLKTYGAKSGKEVDFKAVEVMARMITREKEYGEN